jgi:hypothetical protein
MSTIEPVQSRLAIVLRQELLTWQRLNVTAFLSSSMAVNAEPSVMGETYVDASGRGYGEMFAQPVMVFEASAEVLKSAYLTALEEKIVIVRVFPDVLFTTGNDSDNRAAFAKLAPAQMSVAGLALLGGRNRISKLLSGARKHP